jgi:hypothetical protein
LHSVSNGGKTPGGTQVKGGLPARKDSAKDSRRHKASGTICEKQTLSQWCKKVRR